MKTFITLLILSVFISGVLPNMLWAQDPPENKEPATHPLIQFYQACISGIDGNRCAMYPSCSQYCVQATQKHGFVLGWIMTCDRILRCGRDEVGLAPHVRLNGRQFTFDPVNGNDFWWFSPQGAATENKLPEEKLYHSDSGRMPDLNPDQQK
ncbi:MAG: hypothetical protein CSA25_05035 [Desulfobacter postgatei]|uniref:Membrane protein insertion efficiency factor YidD n=1 Tax=Desulfobacter postgatei TaxID=2293 RepID=A0A2G6MS83_9BACT|nr:MAG: hypothetical protein CSA25_05035 [Desulfobacter postgatei]